MFSSCRKIRIAVSADDLKTYKGIIEKLENKLVQLIYSLPHAESKDYKENGEDIKNEIDKTKHSITKIQTLMGETLPDEQQLPVSLLVK